jgi:hypothetical protein
MSARSDVFTWTFLDEVAWWALGIACIASVAGAAVTHRWTFPLGCLLTVGLDLALVHLSARRGGHVAEIGGVDEGVVLGLFLGGRLALKAVLLVVALVWPWLLDFWGVAAGAVTYDITLAVVGSIVAVGRLNAAGR